MSKPFKEGKDDTVPGCICRYLSPVGENDCRSCYYWKTCKGCTPK